MHATKSSWKTLPAPQQCIPLDLKAIYTNEEFEKILLGLIPDEMEDKWFIYFSDNWLNFHRSWTGHFIYRIKILHTEIGYEIFDSWVNRNFDEYQYTDIEYDKKMVIDLIDDLLLKRKSKIPKEEIVKKKLQKKSRINGQITGLSGELFTAAELLKRDLQTSITFGNAKAIDLFAHNPITNKNFNVQVKSLRTKNWFLISPEKIVKDHIYVFVLLNKPGIATQFYVVPGHIFYDTPEIFHPGLNDLKMPGVHPKQLTSFENSWDVFLK